MGSRYLKYNLENPLTNKKAIERRYDFVEKLSTQFILRDDLMHELNNVYDLEGLKRFDKLGYKYSQEKSNENTYVFIKS